MFTEEIIPKIQEKSSGRFDVLNEDDPRLAELAPRGLNGQRVVRLKRTGFETSGLTTVLLGEFKWKRELYFEAKKWAADVRDSLVGPGEVVDLYLLLHIADLPHRLWLRIEADEHFCRKYVRRPHEDLSDLLDRTFLGYVSGSDELYNVRDPLSSSLRDAGFDLDSQKKLRSELISPQGDVDLADLFIETQTGTPH